MRTAVGLGALVALLAGFVSVDPPPRQAVFPEYADSSPFNRSISEADETWETADSAATVEALTRYAPMPQSILGTEFPERDQGVPVFFADDSDPAMTLDCVRYFFAADNRNCDIDGERIHVPEEARPANQGFLAADATHLLAPDEAVIDGWQVNAAGGVASLDAIGDRTTRPDIPTGEGIAPRLEDDVASFGFETTDIGFVDGDAIDHLPLIARAWFYAETEGATELAAELRFQGSGGDPVKAERVLPPGSEAGWYGMFSTPVNQDDIDSLEVRFSASGGASASVSAAYIELETADAEYDGHLTIVDGKTEYDLFQGISMGEEPTDGEDYLRFGAGGSLSVDETGLAGDAEPGEKLTAASTGGATAAGFATPAGAIRPEEIERGLIDHALTLTVPCTNRSVTPALKGALECRDLESVSADDDPADPATFDNNWEDTEAMPSTGTLLQYSKTPEEIDQLTDAEGASLPKWQRTILKAFHEYGAYVGDTTGARTQWAFRTVSPVTYTAYGQENPWIRIARETGLGDDGLGVYYLQFGPEADFAGSLRAIEPCKAEGSC